MSDPSMARAKATKNVPGSAVEQEIEVLYRKGLTRAAEQGIESWECVEIACSRFPLLEERPKDALRKLIDTAVNLFDDDRRQTAVKLLLGAAHGTNDLTVGRRREEAARVLGISVETFRTSPRHIPSLLEELRLAIERLNAPIGNDPPSPAVFLADHQRVLIERVELLASVRSLLDSGRRLVALVGPPGVGKTALAHHVISSRAAGYIELDASTPDVFESDIRSAVAKTGGDVGHTPVANLFRRLIESKRGPRFVLVENLSSGELLKPFVTDRTRSTFIVTARKKLSSIQPGLQVEIGELGVSEGIELIESLVADVERQHALRLTEELGGNALALVAACSLLQLDPELTINDFCRSISRVASRVFEGRTDGSQPALTEIYRLSLGLVAHENPSAVKVLTHAAMLGPSRIPISVLEHSLGVAESIHPEDQEGNRNQCPAISSSQLLG